MIPAETLKTIPLFARLGERELARLVPLFHHAHYRQGEVLARQGEAGNSFVVLENGTLRVRETDAARRERLRGYLNAPAFFGEPALVAGLPNEATIDVFSVEADLSVLSRQEFGALLSQFPEIRRQLVARSAGPGRALPRYEWLSEGEEILVNTRRHWFAFAARLSLPIVGALILFALAILLPFSAGSIAFQGRNLVAIAGLGLALLAMLLLLGGSLWTAVDWGNDYYVVTNKRVCHIEKTIFLFEEREEAPIEMVTNVVELTQGFAPRVFGFVDLRVETAGRHVEIDFGCAPRAAQIRQVVLAQLAKRSDRSSSEHRAGVRDGIRQQLWQRLAPEMAEPSQDAVAAALAAEETPAPPVRVYERRTRLGRFLRSALALRVDEPDQVTWHKHWFDLFDRVDEPLVALAVLMAVFAAHATGLVPLRVPALVAAGLPGQVGSVVVWLGLCGLAIFWLWYQYEDWNNDLYRVTNDRVVDIERSPFGFEERSVETILDRIQDISYSQSNPIRVFFNYGDIVMETAGAGRFVFYNIQNPRAAAQEIFRRRDAHRLARQRREAQQGRAEFLDWFQEYHELLQQQGNIPPPGEPLVPNTPGDEHPELGPSGQVENDKTSGAGLSPS